MAADYSICLGTAGWGVWHSPDAGKSWVRHRAPFPLNSRIQALVAHPTEAHTIVAGGDTGLFVSHDGGAQWERIGVQAEQKKMMARHHAPFMAPATQGKYRGNKTAFARLRLNQATRRQDLEEPRSHAKVGSDRNKKAGSSPLFDRR